MSYGEKKARLRANLAKLPPVAYASHPDTGEVLAIKRGESGYFVMRTDKTPAQLNAIERVTPEQARAMMAGSMRGWHVPEADPEWGSHEKT